MSTEATLFERIKSFIGWNDEPKTSTVDEEVKELTPEEAKAKADVEDFVERPISSIINLNTIYRVRGKGAGLHYKISAPNMSGMIGMRQLVSGVNIPAHTSALECLGQFVVYKTETKDCKGPDAVVPLGVVLDNVHKHFQGRAITENELTREIACDGYDPDQFKLHHLKRITQWYNQILELFEVAKERQAAKAAEQKEAA